MLMALDIDDEGRLLVTDPYFETSEAQVSDYAGTYVRTDMVMEHTVTHWWNHGIGETVTALIDAGMTVTGLAEHDSVPWAALPGLMTVTDGEWRLAEMPERLAASFTLQAVRNR